MKKIILLLTALFFFFSNSTVIRVFGLEPPPEITAPSGILIDAETGDILYEKNAHQIMYPASTTKIMTAILTLENTKLDDQVVIDKDTPFSDGNRIYAIEGEIFTVEQLLYALLVESANDAAVALAKHVSGSVEEFAKLMNKKSEELGAKNTHFTNPNGLPDEEHVSTAYDLAIISKYAMTLPKFPEFVKTVRYQIPPTNKQPEVRYLKTSNRFLWGVGGRNKIDYKGNRVDIKYDIIEGIKTGYTVQAQQCLVTSASKDGHRLISVILKAQGSNIYIDTRTLIDYGFENFKFIEITPANNKVGMTSVKGGTEKEIDLLTQEQLYKAVPNDTDNFNIDTVLDIKKDIQAPIHKGDILGTIIYKSNDDIIGKINLIASKSIAEKVGITSVFHSEKSFSKSLVSFLTTILSIFILWRSIVTILRIYRKKNKFMRNRLNSNISNKRSIYNDLFTNRKKS